MKKYKVLVREVLLKEVVVTASSSSDAKNRAESAYQNEHIVLDADDFHEYEIDVQHGLDIAEGNYCPNCGDELCWSDDYDESISYPYYCQRCKKSFTEDDVIKK